MRLNLDCLRDLLLSIEDITDADHYFNYVQDKENKFINKYGRNELFYHFRQADLSGFLYNPQYDFSDNFFCTDLSPLGHQFLGDIRADNNWNKTKEVAKKVGSFSIEAVRSIAVGVITKSINDHLSP